MACKPSMEFQRLKGMYGLVFKERVVICTDSPFLLHPMYNFVSRGGQGQSRERGKSSEITCTGDPG